MKKDFFDEGVKLSAVTLSGNGALKYSSSGNIFLDDFASIGRYRELRSYDSVSEDMSKLWEANPLLTLKLTLYLRTISRQEKNLYPTKTVQRGQGLKHEFILRCIWLAEHCPFTFIANLPIFIEGGSWDDLFTILRYDLKLNGWDNRKVNWEDVYSVIDMGCRNYGTVDLVKKYMPRIRNNKSLTTDDSKANNTIARWLAWKMFPNTTIAERANKYRKFKASGNAHTWQQLISNHNYDMIDFNKLPGRVLSQMVKSRVAIHVEKDGELCELPSDGTSFIDRHNLTAKYMDWLQNQKTVKFTGYVYELFKDVLRYYPRQMSKAEIMTINRQFEGLLETGKKDVDTNSKFIVVKDISGSMTANVTGLDVSSRCVASSMALYFSEFLTGPFKGQCINFSNKPTLFKFKGKTPVEKFASDNEGFFGSTNFVGVAHLLVRIKKQGVAEEDFPTGILCVSDGEFNDPYRGDSKDITNFNAFLEILRDGGFSEEFVQNFKIVLWDIPNDFYGGRPKATFEDLGDTENFFYMSGLDPAAISFLMNGKYDKKVPKTAEELFESAMDQELLNKLIVY